jgi:hypothetical protein
LGRRPFERSQSRDRPADRRAVGGRISRACSAPGPRGDPACEAAGRKVSGVRCVYLTRYRPRLLEVASVRCSRSSPKSDFLVLIGQIQGAHESAEQHPMGRDPSGAPKTVQRACGDPHRVGSGTHGRSRPWSSQRPQARLWSREICPGLSGIWCSGPGVRRIRFHDLRHTCACCFWRSVRRPCADGRAGPFSAFDHHGFCTPM